MNISELQFKTVLSRSEVNKQSKNTFFLQRVNWNDYGYYTSFKVYFITEDLSHFELGSLKIMHVEMDNDSSSDYDAYSFLPTSFTSLPLEFCSVGTQNYYEELMGVFPNDQRSEILIALNDCAFNKSIFDKLKDTDVMKVSLLRDLDESKVKVLFPSILNGHAILTPFSFKFSFTDNPRNHIDFEVKPLSSPPSNIHVLIGRNGVGKTRIISGIVDELTKEQNDISLRGKLEFISRKEFIKSERFVNLIAVVFSAFDHFKPPPENNNKSGSVTAHYIGLKEKNGRTFKTPEELEKEFNESLDNISTFSNRINLWKEAIEILHSDQIIRSFEFPERDLDLTSERSRIKKIFKNLSSGHRIVLLIISRLVELVDEKTLVLIDEPENHLHPPLLSSFIRALSNLMKKRNGVAIIATHSPVVLQEVPAYCVTKIERVNQEYSLYRPQLETYAENIDTLTRDVFRLELEDSGFYESIKNKIKDGVISTYSEFLEEFENHVGSEGRALAKSLISTKEQ